MHFFFCTLAASQSSSWRQVLLGTMLNIIYNYNTSKTKNIILFIITLLVSGSSYRYYVSAFLLPYLFFVFDLPKSHTIFFFLWQWLIPFLLYHSSLVLCAFVSSVSNCFCTSSFCIKTLNIVGKTVISSEPCSCSLMVPTLQLYFEIWYAPKV